MDFSLNYKELEQVDRAFRRLPGEIKVKAMARAMRQITGVARTRIVDETGKISKLPRPTVAAVTTASFNAGGNTQKYVVKSGWIHLIKLGAVQSPTGVYVAVRGSYRHAFIAGMKSGHVGVMRRVNEKGRFPIREQFAANPANVITNKPDEYLNILAQIIAERYLPRVLHEVDYLLASI